MIPATDQHNYTKAGILAQIDVSLGGRVAEELILDVENTTSGNSDLLT